MKKNISFYVTSLLLVILFGSCQKFDKPGLGNYPTDDSKPPLPGGDLRFFIPFTTNDQIRYAAMDSISGDPAWVFPLSLTDGVNGGKAVQGTDGKAIKYMNSNDLDEATSLSVALWVKENVPSGRTEFLFSLVDNTYGWSHSGAFLMMEHGTTSAVTLKFGLMDQWLEFPDSHQFPYPVLDGNWHHLAFVYDQNTSKMTYYFDGAVVPDAPASATDVKKDGNPRGALDLSKITNIVVGGWNRNANVAGPTDDWVKSYTGALDQFRIYNKALTAAEVNALFTSKE